MHDREPDAGATVMSLVVPAFNEGLRLPATLEQICRYLHLSPELQPAEVIVVDDGSSDHTAAAAEAVAAPQGVELVLLRHPHNRGKGAAVRTGFARARGRQVLLSDADLATPIEELSRLLEAAGDDTVVVGSRAVDRELISVRQPIYRDLMGRVFNLIEQLLAVRGIRDTQCGFKLFPGTLARALAAVQRLDGFAFDVELLLLSRRWGYRLCEVGVRWRHVEASRVQAVRHSAQMLRDLLRIAWWRLSGSLASAPRAAEREPTAP